MDALRRGWSPDERTRRRLRIAAGLLLVLAPAYLGWLGIGETTNRYRTAEVTAENGTLTFEPGLPPDAAPADLDCVTALQRDRLCLLERELLAGNVTTDGVLIAHGEPAHAVHDGRLYRRRAVDTLEGTELALTPADPEAFLDRYARPIGGIALPTRVALWTGSVRTPGPMPNGDEFLRTDDGVVLLYGDERDPPVAGDGEFGLLVSAVAVVAGLRLLRPS